MYNKYILESKNFVPVENEDDYTWLEIINPTEDELKFLLSDFNLPKDYIFDVNDPYELPRTEGLEDDRPNLFILSYPIRLSNKDYITRPIAIIVAKEKVITIYNEKSDVFENLKSNKSHKVDNIDEIENFVLEMAWEISKAYIDYVKILDKEIDELESQTKRSTRTYHLEKIIALQKSLTIFQMSIRENAPVIESIFEMGYLEESENRDDLLRDLQVENKQARVMVERSTVMLDKLSELYTNVINNNLNEVMKTLTSVTILMTIPTIVGGIWGMNVRLPWENIPHAFWILLLLCLVVGIITLIILKRRDYL
ncbi:magnesium transporter CorA family protein [Peptoniphilus sp.]|jgi:magnesium transporter|uniref:magnesium transporter CorA family protein n=1 Tax=Peptoniphilus sp. TaxID=1971214 RepID=UPI003D8DDD4A